MSADNVAPSRDALQFDRALTAGAPAGAAPSASVTCANCGTSISTEYYHIAGHPVCRSCRDIVQAKFETPRGWKPFLKAGAFGLAAAIAGAIIYYAVIAIANLEIGIVAILIGYMVGYMVRKALGGKGGRRYQILALALTYWSVGLAYTPLAFKGIEEGRARATARVDSTHATADSAAPTASADTSLTRTDTAKVSHRSGRPVTGTQFLIALGAVLLMTVALPVVVVFGSLPSGFLSAIIILVGLRQAWRMTAAPALNVSGPYKVGSAPTSATA